MASDAIKAVINPNGGLDVNIQDQTTDSISLFVAQTLDTVTVYENTPKDSESITIETTGYVPVVGNFLCLQEEQKITQVEITGVTNIGGSLYDLTIAVPLDYAYTTVGGCSIQNVNMNVNGSLTDVIFTNTPIASMKWDVTRIIFSMILITAGDDGRFGNLTALTKGVYFRKEDGNTSQNLFNIKRNSDLRLEGYDVAYTTRSGGGGDYGMAARITFAGQEKRGVTIRLDGNLGEQFKGVVRDNLTTLPQFRIKIQGHIVD